MTVATAKSGHSLSVHATKAAATITMTLASVPSLMSKQIAMAFASPPSRKRESTQAAATLATSAAMPTTPIMSAPGGTR